MYKSFKLKNFRCFPQLEIPELERVNVIAGTNNVGKTALLEALFLHCGAYNPALTIKVGAFRGLESIKLEFGRWAETPWDNLFYQFDTTESIEISGEDTRCGHRLLRLTVVHDPLTLVSLDRPIQYKPEEASQGLDSIEGPFMLNLHYEEGKEEGGVTMLLDASGARIEPPPPAPPFSAFYQGARMRIPFSQESERYGKLELYDKQDVLLKALQLIEPRLRRLTVVVAGGVPILHGDIQIGRLVPLPIMGEGMARLTSLILHISNAENGVVLVDEVENGLHYSVMGKVWTAIGEAARQFNTQVFATTHSRECIIAAHESFLKSGIYDFRLHRLDRMENTIETKTYDQEALSAAIEIGLEVR